MSDANSLLPCPFCGGDAEEMGGMLLARVGCVACDAAIDANTQKRANQRWNARQSAPRQTPAPQGEMPEPAGYINQKGGFNSWSPYRDLEAVAVPTYTAEQMRAFRAAWPVSTGADAKDAARYRFLRNRGDEQFNGRTLVIALHHDDGTSHGLLYDAADAAIDAAMADEAGKV